MATNKRKESAALFELIDKSTLKVPKSGSLKIPSWWSSSTNPPAPKKGAAPSISPPPAPTVAPAVSGDGAATQNTAVAEAVIAGSEAATEGAPEGAEVPIQARLFEPPPANVTPSNSPSIRPPVAAVIAAPVGVSSEPGAGAGPAEGSSAAAPSIAPPPLPKGGELKKEGAESAVPKKDGAAGRSAAPAQRIFAPQTVAQNRKVWTPPRPGTFARMPLWTLIAAGAGLVAVVVLAVMVGKYATRTKPVQKAPVAETRGAVATQSTIGFGRAAASAPAMAPHVARIYNAGEVARTQGLYYIVVYTTPTRNTKPEDSVAYTHAKFLRDHGIDCSIETVLVRNQMWYWVVTVQGLPNATAADAQLSQIKKIGDQMKQGIWNSAYPSKELASQGTGATRP